MLIRKAAARSTESGMLPILATRKKWITSIGIHETMYTPISKRTVLATFTWLEGNRKNESIIFYSDRMSRQYVNPI